MSSQCTEVAEAWSLTKFSEAARAVRAAEEANGILKDVRAASCFSVFLYASIDTWFH